MINKNCNIKDEFMKYIHSLYIGLLSLLFVGCQEEQLNNMQTGGFQISLQDVAADITTKTLPKDLEGPLVSNFQLKITNEVSGSSIYNGAYTSNLIPASTGIYTISATHGDNPPLAKDNPYYKGDTTGVELEEDQVASVELKCRVANALASVVYTSEAMFKEVFTDYGVKVGIGNLMVDLENGTTESAYYQAGSIPTFTFVGTLKGNGKEVTKVLEDPKLTDPSTFAAGQHCKITLSLSTTTAGVNLDIEKVEATPVTITATIPMEWLPAPKVSATGFDGRNTLTIYETEKASSASIDFNVAQPLQDLYFKLKFEDENLSSLNKGEGAEYQLSEMSEEEKRAFTSAGIILPSIGSTEPQIIFSEDFISKLLSKNDGTVSNIIVIDSVKANDRINKDESPLSYTIAVNKPEFTIDVLDGNVWSKTFTAEEISVSEGRGNLETIKKNLVYQYQETDGTWQDFSNQDARQQVFAEHPLNRNFKVRALYRGELVSNEKDVELESQDQLQNSGMEDWYIETKKKSGTWPFKDKTYYTFHPYADGAVNSSWWDTNNDKAQGGTYALGIWYEGCFASCVSYTEDAHSGSKAALMYLSGCGDGYANTPVTYVGGAMVGSLFIGSYNNGIVQGHDFGVRPTSLTFWYKYKPYNTDAFKVVVSLKNGEKEIATGTYEPTAYSSEDGEYKQASVDFNYLIEDEKATTICVQFLASSKTKLSQSDFNMGTTITYPVIGNWTVHMGSVLKIDDISLVYDK